MGAKLAPANRCVNSWRELCEYSNRYTTKLMDVREIRKNRLITLIHEYKTQRALADAIGRPPSLISQIATGHRGMGEDLAREIEQQVNKPPGWMDGKEDPLSYLPPDEQALIRKYRKADPRGKRTIQGTAEDQSAYEGPGIIDRDAPDDAASG